MAAAAHEVGLSHFIGRVGSMMTFFFHDQAVHSWRDAEKCKTDLFAKYFWALLDRGVYMPCSQYEALFISAAHREQDIDDTVAAAREAFASL